MNKTILSFFAIASLVFLVACGGKGPDTVEANEKGEAAKATATSASYAIDAANSSMNWSGGKKIGQDTHTGTIAISNGAFEVENGNIAAGNFTVDMTSLAVTDQTPDDYKVKLAGHLKGDDFFNVELFPTASFTLTKVVPSTDSASTHSISGNLTIRDVTKEITIPATVSMTEDQIFAKSSFAINRADFNVKYGSATHIVDIAQDDIIKDEIEFQLAVIANKAAAEGTK